MKTALVTGGAGFIGSNLCRKLLEQYKVICVDNLVSGSQKNLKELETNSNFKFIQHDVTKPIDIKADMIFHLACPASPSPISKISYLKMPIETLMTNALGTKNMLDLAIKNNCPVLITSTSEVYGNPSEHPQKETYNGNVSPIGIRSCYDEGKRFAEALAMAYFREKVVNVKIVRIFNTYGPGMRFDDGRAVPNFVMQALKNEPLTMYGKGNQTRSMCYIDDMIDGLLKVMSSEQTIGEVFNIGNPSEITMLKLAETIKKLCGSKSEIKYMELPKDDPERRKPDIAKIKKVLGWEPKTDLNTGLKKTIEWFKATCL